MGPISDLHLQHAIELRTLYGLRADEAWIRKLARDPQAQLGITEFGVPLSPAELQDIRGRRWDEDLLRHVQTYCSSVPDDCAGAYINLSGSGVVVDIAQNIDLHRQALASMAAESIKVQEVEWSWTELTQFAEQVADDGDWFASLEGVELIQALPRVERNDVVVDFRSATDQPMRAIEAHFGHPTWLTPRWVPAEWDGPRADLVVKVYTSDGEPAPEIRCELEPLDPKATLGFDDWLFGSNERGVCLGQNIPAVAYNVRVLQWTNNDHDEVVDQLQVVVPSSGLVIEHTIN